MNDALARYRRLLKVERAFRCAVAISVAQGIEERDLLGGRRGGALGVRAEHDAAADDVHGGIRPHDEEVLPGYGKLLVEADLGIGSLARLETLLVPDAKDSPCDLARSVRNMDARPAFEGFVGRGEAEVGEVGIEAVGRGNGVGRCEKIAWPHLFGGKRVQVECNAMAGLGAIDALSVDLDAPHAGHASAREHFKFVTYRNGAAPKRSRYDCACAFDCENAVDRQASAVGSFLALRCFRCPVKRRLQVVEPLSRAARYGNDLGFLVGSTRKATFHLIDHEFDPFVVNEVDFRERDDERGDAQKLKHGQVLGCLGHDSIVSCDAQECHVDAGRARDHLADELLVTGNVDHA